MKRVNVFLDGSVYDKLEEIKEKVQDSDLGMPYCYSITKADLIRFALHYTYKLKFPDIHTWDDVLERALKQRELID